MICRGSALAAATGGDPILGKQAILALMDAVSASTLHAVKWVISPKLQEECVHIKHCVLITALHTPCVKPYHSLSLYPTLSSG